jgi:hypothetical protein
METNKTTTLYQEYELDRDIPVSIWNNYLKKYENRYITFKGEDGVLKIKCKFGQIEPYSLKKGYLLFFGKFPTPTKKTYFLKNLKENIEVTQMGSDEVVFKFLEKNLNILSEDLKIRKRMNLSNEQREAKAKRMFEIRKKLKR